MAIGFWMNNKNCYGCKTCSIACKSEKQLDKGVLLRHVTVIRQDAPRAFAYLSMACNHCEEPACVANCPVGAYSKLEDGTVIQDHSVCIGCKTCETACPYGAPTYGEEEGYMLKCDMCRGEVAAGGKPICVTGCPMRALDFGTREEMIEKYGEGDVEVEPLPADTTGPNLILTPHRDAQKSGSGTGSVVNLEEEL